MQIERRAGHRVAVVPAVTMDDAACGDGDRSEHALLALDRSAARPAVDEQGRGLADVARHPLRAQESCELCELRLPDPESVELAGASHEDRLGIAREREAALFAEHRNAVDESEELVEAVLDHQERTLAPHGERGERADDLACADRIEIRRRLVEHECSRAHGEQRGECDALLGTAGERVQPSRRRGAKAGGRASLRDALDHLVAREAEVLEPEGDLVVGLEHHELRLGILEEHADVPRELRELRAPRVAAADRQDAALPVRVERVWDQAVEAERERALPRAARTEQEQALALFPFEVEIVERRSFPSDVPDGKRLGPREHAQTSRTRSRPSAK